MNKINVNSAEYRALVTRLLGKEVEFTEIAIPKEKIIVSPVSSPRNSREKYVIVNTGYSYRLIDKLKADEKFIKDGYYKISNPEQHNILYRKIVFLSIIFGVEGSILSLRLKKQKKS
jgi:hypothetical protein